MKKKSKYGRNPKLNPKTHCVMVRFDDVEWNRFLTCLLYTSDAADE